jgi:putative inorganic carbon (HCO3(-)) transporter
MRIADRSATVVGLALLSAAGFVVASLVAGAADVQRAPEPLAAAMVVVGLGLIALAARIDPAWTFSAAVVCSVFSARWDELGFPIPVDRFFLGLVLFALTLRIPLRPPLRIRIGAVHVLIALAAAFATGSALLHGSLLESKGGFALLDRFGLVPFLCFLIAPAVFKTAEQRNILLAALVLCGAYLGFTALMEALKADALIWPRYILDAQLGLHSGRARGPFLEAGAMGVGLADAGIAALIAAHEARSRALRVTCFLIAGLCALGMLLTLTRAIWVAGVLAAGVTLVVVPYLRRYLVPTAAAGVALVVGALLVIPGLSAEITQRQSEQSPVYGRLTSGAAAVRMVEARPLTGFGWDQFQYESLPFLRYSDNHPVYISGDLHNVFLANAAELGLVGMSLWLGALLLAVGGAIVRPGPPELRHWRAGLLAVAVVWAVDANFSPLSYPFPNVLLWTWAGVVWAGSAPLRLPTRAAVEARATPRPRRR